MDIETQIKLEELWIAEGATVFQQSFSKQPFSDTNPGAYVLGKSLEDMEQGIQEFLKEHNFKNKLHQGVFMCVPSLELATLTLKFLMDVAFSAPPGFHKSPYSACVSSLSIKLGGLVLSHLNYVVFRKTHDKGYDHMMDFLKSKSKRYKSRTLQWWKEATGHIDVEASTADKAAVGYHLLKLAVESTGLFEILPKHIPGGHGIHALYPSPDVLNHVLSSVDKLSAMHPMVLPMVVPPKPWVSWDDGGYYRMPCRAIIQSRKTTKELWDDGAIQVRLPVLDFLGSIPWEINPEILSLMDIAYKNNHSSVPLSDLQVQMPPKPWTDRASKRFLKSEHPEILYEWTKEVAKIYNEFYSSRLVGQRMAFLRLLSIARRFSTFPAIWFPWHMDYRGRYYPIPHTLTPQGDERSRALLRFHTRTKLSPSDIGAWRWYLIQGSNLMGNDKVSLEERVAFTRKNHDNIMAVAASPFDNQWWTEADKPWLFLAWCLEYSKIVSGRQDYTQLPVNRDGKCNGLQHLAMATKDEQVGSLVSLVPSEKPSDIYTKAAQAITDALPCDSYWKDKVTRKLIKRNVMTTPYNVTSRGMGEQLKEELLVNSPDLKLTKEDKIRACELRDVNHRTIMGLLNKCAELMQWYNTVANIHMKENLKIKWRLPDGFLVIQDMAKLKRRKVELEHKTVVVHYNEPTLQQDSLRNRNAMSPNVTHSMDATHMTLFIKEIIRTLGKDTPMMAIHDSFGMPAPQVDHVGNALVKTLVDLYEGFSITEAIMDNYRSQTNGKELPMPPQVGTLDYQSVLNSVYAFA